MIFADILSRKFLNKTEYEHSYQDKVINSIEEIENVDVVQ